eukprot:TRINITY_DN62085_c0_g1_i2.p1 TRINITY_DN62085_c0_g1~~TRINITY_DN62085_c0_g1_i2.p1  ORF type:complete len:586 (+),score=50.12 TRINITY_DN62085_c0_g1_i2:66-1823(+)
MVRELVRVDSQGTWWQDEDDHLLEELLRLTGMWTDDWGFYYMITISPSDRLLKVEQFVMNGKQPGREMQLKSPKPCTNLSFITSSLDADIFWNWQNLTYELRGFEFDGSSLEWRLVHGQAKAKYQSWRLCRTSQGGLWLACNHNDAHEWYRKALTKRAIGVARPDAISEETPEDVLAASVSAPQWVYAAGDGWLPFPKELADGVETAWAERLGGEPATRSFSAGRYSYSIDFIAMTQTNQQTGRVREVRRQEMSAEDLEDPLLAANARIVILQQELEAQRCTISTAVKQEGLRLGGVISDMQKRLDHLAHLATTVDSLRVEKERLCRAAHEEAECWRKMSLAEPLGGDAVVVQKRDAPDLCKCLQECLRQRLCPSGAQDPACKAASSVTVDKVERIINPTLWRMYCSQKQRIKMGISSGMSGRVCLDIADTMQEVKQLRTCLDYANLDALRTCSFYANEVLLLHGTPCANAPQIIAQGFDDRLASRELYVDMCKVLQYCKLDRSSAGKRCFFLSRVILGDPYMAPQHMPKAKRPPEAPCGRPFDSIVAQRGITNGTPNKQVHLEFVVRDTQVYPECLVWFSMPGP